MYKYILPILLLGCVSLLSFTVVSKGTDCSAVFEDCTPRQEIIKQPGSLPDSIEKNIDFSKEMVAVIITDQKTTGGYAVDVLSVSDQGNVEIVYVETSPGKNCMVTMALTQPYIVVKMPKVDKEVQFIKKSKVNEC